MYDDLSETLSQARTKLELESQAKHEAAHAVAAYLMGAQVLSVTVEGDGETVVRWPPAPNPLTRTYVERRIAYCLSGQLVGGPELDVNSYDSRPYLRLLALQIYGYAIGFQEDSDCYDLWMAGQDARHILPRQPLAALRVLESIAMRTQELVTRHMTAIEAVADQLAEHGALTGEEVHRFVEQGTRGEHLCVPMEQRHGDSA